MSDINICRIAVHDGGFHADDVFAVALLKLLNPDIDFIRTLDQEKLSGVDARIDVGGKYCHETKDYDHHQKEGAGKRENGIPYASAGLIWKHYGYILAGSQDAFDYIDEKIMQYIDANDNGIKTHEAMTAAPYTLADMIRAYSYPCEQGSVDPMVQFGLATGVAMNIMQNELMKANDFAEHNQIVRETLKRYAEKPYVLLPKKCMWERVIVRETDKLYVIYPDSSKWKIHAVPIEEDCLPLRKPFPKPWAGLMDDALAKETGVPDAKFCHKNLFLATAKTQEAATKLAELASTYT